MKNLTALYMPPFIGRGYSVDENGFLFKKGKPMRPYKHPLGDVITFYFTIDGKHHKVRQKDLISYAERQKANDAKLLGAKIAQ